MAHHIVLPQSTSNLLLITLRSSTTGQALTGKTHSDVTITWTSAEDASTLNTVTPVTMTLDTWVSGGFKESVQAGDYQFGLPNAVANLSCDASLKVTCAGAIDVFYRVSPGLAALRAGAIAADVITDEVMDTMAGALLGTVNGSQTVAQQLNAAAGGGAITVIDAADAILTSTSPTTDTDDGTATIYTGASYTGTGQGIGKSRSWTGDDLNSAAATLYVLRQDLYEDPTDATAWTALDTTTLTQSGTTLAASFNPDATATAALATGHNGDGSTTYRAHIVATASKTPLWDFQIIVRRGEWA